MLPGDVEDESVDELENVTAEDANVDALNADVDDALLDLNGDALEPLALAKGDAVLKNDPVIKTLGGVVDVGLSVETNETDEIGVVVEVAVTTAVDVVEKEAATLSVADKEKKDDCVAERLPDAQVDAEVEDDAVHDIGALAVPTKEGELALVELTVASTVIAAEKDGDRDVLRRVDGEIEIVPVAEDTIESDESTERLAAIDGVKEAHGDAAADALAEVEGELSPLKEPPPMLALETAEGVCCRDCDEHTLSLANALNEADTLAERVDVPLSASVNEGLVDQLGDDGPLGPAARVDDAVGHGDNAALFDVAPVSLCTPVPDAHDDADGLADELRIAVADAEKDAD